MFGYVIASLAPEFAAEICDLIITPPAETPYDILKGQYPLIRDAYSNFSVLKNWEIRDLLSCFVVYNNWLVILLELMELSLESCFYNTYQVMSEWLWHRHKVTHPSINLLNWLIKSLKWLFQNSLMSVQPSSSELGSLHAKIVSLKQHITSLKKGCCCTHSPYCRCPTSPAPPLQLSDKICWYHRNFGDC